VDKAPAGTILVIEDSDSVRIAISRFLKAGGFDVLDAGTPEAAKSIWSKHANRICLLIADINLNTSSGPDLIEELFKCGPVVPVIFATAMDEIRRQPSIRNFQSPTIIQKPFTADNLVQAVRTALSEQSRPAGFTTFFKRPTLARAEA
jgi:two-component system, cell cycle sensor histidine kinase and response regulator CckA